MGFDKQVALVTGGAQGIGRAVAERFLRDGWAVAVIDIDPEACAEARSALEARGEAVVIVGDVANEDEVRRTVAQTEDRFGRLNALVNNAGISGRKPLAALSLDEWHRVLGVNLTGAFLFARHAAPLLRRQGGAIVNVASTRALMSEPDSEAYAASKGGLVALTHALAISLGPAVRVNCISPGWIDVSAWKKSAARRPAELRAADHAQHPAGRVGRPEDVADLVFYLCSPTAGFLTGANIVADGGMTRKMIYT